MISGANEIEIRKAILKDLDAIKSLADAHRQELGFVRRPALIRSIDRQEVAVACNHQKVVGFIEYHHRRDDQTTLYNIVVDSKHRCRGIGRALMNFLRTKARNERKQVIRLKCPANLEANRFYEKLGYWLVEKESGKRRELMVWELSL